MLLTYNTEKVIRGRDRSVITKVTLFILNENNGELVEDIIVDGVEERAITGLLKRRSMELGIRFMGSHPK